MIMSYKVALINPDCEGCLYEMTGPASTIRGIGKILLNDIGEEEMWSLCHGEDTYYLGEDFLENSQLKYIRRLPQLRNDYDYMINKLKDRKVDMAYWYDGDGWLYHDFGYYGDYDWHSLARDLNESKHRNGFRLTIDEK